MLEAGPDINIAAETEATGLYEELDTAFKGVQKAIRAYADVEGRVRHFLDVNDVIEHSTEGLPEQINRLYQFWKRTPDPNKIDQASHLRI